MEVSNLKNIITFHSSKSIFNPNVDLLNEEEWNTIIAEFSFDYNRYYKTTNIDGDSIMYFPGLLATLYYRISRYCFLKADEKLALEFASLGFNLSGIEIYYSAEIGRGLKINHGISTVIGARVKIGHNVLLHHNITLGDKNNGRPVIGNNVIIYPGAIIVGDIYIGDFSIVGANTFTDKSHPDKSKII